MWRSATGAALALALAAWIGCGEREEQRSAPAAPPAPAIPEAPRKFSAAGPDACTLLADADPKMLLGGELGAPWRIYGLCRVEVPGSGADGTPERSVGLEVRVAEEGVKLPTNLDEFWLQEDAGVGFAGGKREQLVQLPGIGDFALWHPITGGLRVFGYWGGRWILVLTVMGTPQEKALPWAQELARVTSLQPWRDAPPAPPPTPMPEPEP